MAASVWRSPFRVSVLPELLSSAVMVRFSAEMIPVVTVGVEPRPSALPIATTVSPTACSESCRRSPSGSRSLLGSGGGRLIGRIGSDHAWRCRTSTSRRGSPRSSRPLDHVVVRDHLARRRHDHSGALEGLLLLVAAAEPAGDRSQTSRPWRSPRRRRGRPWPRSRRQLVVCCPARCCRGGHTDDRWPRVPRATERRCDARRRAPPPTPVPPRPPRRSGTTVAGSLGLGQSEPDPWLPVARLPPAGYAVTEHRGLGPRPGSAGRSPAARPASGRR